MKVAVISDIHANLVAFERVLEDLASWKPDQVIVAGDIVNRGPRPSECLQIVLEKQRTAGWLVVRGNHEDYVISQTDPQAPTSGPVFDTHLPSYWTYRKLGSQVTALLDMPFQVSFNGPDGREFRGVHASMLGNRRGIYPETGEEQLQALTGPTGDRPAVLAVGHTHRPLVRRLGKTWIVNAGSAGLPFDGDTRPSYARLAWQKGEWAVEIMRLDYDLLRAEQDFFDSGYAWEAGPLIALVLVELRTASSQLYNWAAAYQAQVMAGEISMQASVSAHLNSYGLISSPPYGTASAPTTATD